MNATWTIARNLRDLNGDRHKWAHFRQLQRVADRWADTLLIGTGCL